MRGGRGRVRSPAVAGTRRGRARQQRLLRRTSAARIAVVGVLTVGMLGPSLRAPAPRADSAVPAPTSLAAGPDARHPLGSLRIPALGLETDYAEGVDAAVLDLGPGHLPGSPLPGAPGNAVLAGRRRSAAASFAHLDRLVPGDEVLVATPAAEVAYRVVETLVVDGASWEDSVLVQPDGAAARMLTLFACHPSGSDAERIVVRARAER